MFCVVVDDIAGHEGFYLKLDYNDELNDVNLSAARKQIKFTTVVPLVVNCTEGGKNVS